MSIRSYRKSKLLKMNMSSYQNGTLNNYALFTSQALRKGGNSNIKDLIITLCEMGFDDETVERAIYFGEVKSIEEAMYYLVPNKDELWEHKFIPEEYCKPQDWCLFCKRHQHKVKE